MSAVIPAVGQRWRMKRSRDRVATITYVALRPETFFGGYVQIDAPWIKKHSGKSMDVFLKYYEPIDGQ